MDLKNFIEGDNLNANIVKNSVSKKAVIISQGFFKKMNDGVNKFEIVIEMDGKQWNYIPNKESLQNISFKYGYETSSWIGKTINFGIKMMSNMKEGVIAFCN